MKWLVTGGAGFIGCNTAARLIKKGYSVVIYDNVSRRGADDHLRWIGTHGSFDFVKGDVRDFDSLGAVFRAHPNIDVVLHLAAQVAVTTSVTNPRDDFETNALGTFNVCETVRQFAPRATLLYASTNKVYGEMTHLKVIEDGGRYAYANCPQGASEGHALDFHSPYGCSKGAGDQYVLDYARIYGLRTVSLRQSCIYGPRQFGVEDQGWVAWFTIASVLDRAITIYGDGKQVRDVLFVDDLVDCYLKTATLAYSVSGRAYNIGGGPENAMSLLELTALLEKTLGKKIAPAFADWRPGDQRVFICDIGRAKRELQWEPQVSKTAGVTRLIEWVKKNSTLFE